MQKHCVVCLLFLLCWFSAPLVTACQITKGASVPILVFPPKYKAKRPAEDYIFRLIQLALKASEDKYGPCEARLLGYDLPLKRMELYLEKNLNIDVVSLTVKEKRDKRFRAVRIPIAKGMVGLRVFLIRRGEQHRFSSISNLSELKTMVAGQGKGWVDEAILQYNGIEVLASGNVTTLQDMLVAGRFDYYPRGALQLIPEMKIYENMPIDVEQKLILSYPSMTAFYVNKYRPELAERLEYGLRKVIRNGSFDDLFYSHPTTVKALENLNIDKRTVIKLCNPKMPEWMPVDVDEYWLHPWPKDMCKGLAPKAKG